MPRGRGGGRGTGEGSVLAGGHSENVKIAARTC